LFYSSQYLKLPLWIFSELKEQKEFNKHQISSYSPDVNY
jgi:hypothetical protein